MIEIRYFAWVRERIGKPLDQYAGNARSITELLDELVTRDEGYEAAFSDREILRFAIDQETANSDAPIKDAKEIAIFPPMTGG